MKILRYVDPSVSICMETWQVSKATSGNLILDNYTKTVEPFQYWFGSISFSGHLTWKSTCIAARTSVRFRPTYLENTTKLLQRAKMWILCSRRFTCPSNTSLNGVQYELHVRCKAYARTFYQSAVVLKLMLRPKLFLDFQVHQINSLNTSTGWLNLIFWQPDQLLISIGNEVSS
jgi:hypothetical protein